MDALRRGCLAAHLILSVIGISTMLGSMAFGAVAFRGWFRLYSLITLATVVTFFGLALSYAPEVSAGQPTPFIGLYERIAFVPTCGFSCLWRSCGAGGVN